jgi:hypothetical protein
LDPSSGAAIATLDGLKLLARAGFPCKALCPSKLDLPGEAPVEQLLVDRGYAIERREQLTAAGPVQLLRRKKTGRKRGRKRDRSREENGTGLIIDGGRRCR